MSSPAGSIPVRQRQVSQPEASVAQSVERRARSVHSECRSREMEPRKVTTRWRLPIQRKGDSTGAAREWPRRAGPTGVGMRTGRRHRRIAREQGISHAVFSRSVPEQGRNRLNNVRARWRRLPATASESSSLREGPAGKGRSPTGYGVGGLNRSIGPIENGEMPTRQSPRVGKGAVGKRNRSWETRTST
jgi:hypothetical protein